MFTSLLSPIPENQVSTSFCKGDSILESTTPTMAKTVTIKPATAKPVMVDPVSVKLGTVQVLTVHPATVDPTLVRSVTTSGRQNPIDAFTKDAKYYKQDEHYKKSHGPFHSLSFLPTPWLRLSRAKPQALHTAIGCALRTKNTADVERLGQSLLRLAVGPGAGVGDVQTILEIGNYIFDAGDYLAARPYLQKAYDENGINTLGDLQALAYAWTKDSCFYEADAILQHATLQFPNNAALIAERGNRVVYKLLSDKPNPQGFEQQRQNALQFYAAASQLQPDSWQIKQNMEVVGVLTRAASYGSVVQHLPPLQRGEPTHILGAIVSGLKENMTLKINGSIVYPGGMLKINDTCDRVDNVQLSTKLLQIQRTWNFAAQR